MPNLDCFARLIWLVLVMIGFGVKWPPPDWWQGVSNLLQHSLTPTLTGTLFNYSSLSFTHFTLTELEFIVSFTRDGPDLTWPDLTWFVKQQR
jgi:hypothetical protein